MVKLLISQGVITDRDALLVALTNRHLYTSLYLLREGADPSRRDLFLEALDEDTLPAIDLMADNDSIDTMAVARLHKKNRIRDAIFSIVPTLGGLDSKVSTVSSLRYCNYR